MLSCTPPSSFSVIPGLSGSYNSPSYVEDSNIKDGGEPGGPYELYVGDDGEYVGDDGEYVGDDGEYVGDDGEYVGDDGEYVGDDGEYVGDDGEYVGDDGEYVGDDGEYVGDDGLYVGDVGLYVGDLGLYVGDVGIYCFLSFSRKLISSILIFDEIVISSSVGIYVFIISSITSFCTGFLKFLDVL